MVEKIKLEGVVEGGGYGKVGIRVNIIDNHAVAQFSNPKLAKDLAIKEKNAGNKDIRYEERRQWLHQIYQGKTAKEIAKIITKELNITGVKTK